MKKVIIFGNSGSGKSTKAKQLCNKYELSHLDLDTLAWLPKSPPERRPLSESKSEIIKFIQTSDKWVIEGCYTDLLEIALSYSTEIIYMNLPIAECIQNANDRPWEPHKYASKAAQDSNLEMLIDWISQYAQRDDTFSKKSHDELYNEYRGHKKMLRTNGEL